MKELTTKNYWVDYWEKNLEKDRAKKYYVKILEEVLIKYIPISQKNKLFIELGCCPGSNLIFFKKYFDCKVIGIDFIESCCIIIKKFLFSRNVEGTVMMTDVRALPFKKKSFDIVSSFGLVEHFIDYSELLNTHIELLKKGGFLVIVIPNFYNIFYKLKNYFVKKDYMTHIHKENFEKSINKFGIETIYCNYAGVFRKGELTEGHYAHSFIIFYRLINPILSVAERILNILLFSINLKKETRLFSPLVVFIGKKKF